MREIRKTCVSRQVYRLCAKDDTKDTSLTRTISFFDVDSEILIYSNSNKLRDYIRENNISIGNITRVIKRQYYKIKDHQSGLDLDQISIQ